MVPVIKAERVVEQTGAGEHEAAGTGRTQVDLFFVQSLELSNGRGIVEILRRVGGDDDQSFEVGRLAERFGWHGDAAGCGYRFFVGPEILPVIQVLSR